MAGFLKKSALAGRWPWRLLRLLATLGLLALGFAASPALAAIVLEGSASGLNADLPTDGEPGALTIARPAVAKPGMALVASIAARPSQMTWTIPAGWTELSVAAEQLSGGSSTDPGGMTMKTFYRIVDINEPTSYTWTFANTKGLAPPYCNNPNPPSYSNCSAGGSAVGGMLVFSGLDTSSNPLDATPTSRLNPNNSSTNWGIRHYTNAVTTASNNAMVVSMISYLSAGRFSNPVCASGGPAAITEALDVRAPTAADAIGTTLQMAYFTQATAGVSCAPRADASDDGDTGVGHLMALKPSLRDLSLSVSRSGPLTPGGAASYTMTVTNAGSLPEPGPLTIVNTLPAGLSYVSASGAGWSCSAAGQTVSCQKTGALAAGASATPLVINVNVAGGTSGVVTYSATASGTGGDGNTINNTASDSYVIATQPYAEYRLDETSWGSILDSSGNGRNASALGTAEPLSNPSTPPGSALSGSPGTCGIGSIPSGTGTNGINTNIDVNSLGNAGSITFWYASKEAWRVSNRMLFDASNNLGNDDADKHFFLVKTSNGQLRFALEDTGDTGSTATSPSYNFAANTWHHVAITWDLQTDRLNIYLDGDTAPVATATTNVNGTLGDMATLYFGARRMANIGGTPGGYTNNTANAYLDEIRLYAKALDPMEIADIAAQRHSCGGVSIATPGAVTEGNSGTSTLNFTVSLDSTRSSNVSVQFATSNGSAAGGANCAAGVDYVTTSGTLTIPAGSLTATIPVTICGDTLYEDNESFTVTLSDPSGVILDSPNTATGTINNDDAPPAVSVGNVQTTEGDSGTKSLGIPVTLGAASGMVTTVDYTLANGTATGGGSCGGATDFINTGGTVSIAAGAMSGTIDVPICGDTTYESDETFTVTLSDPGNATLGMPSSATGTIVNDDVDPAGCYLDTFTGADNSAPSSNWTTTTSSGSFGAPRIFGNRLRLTDNSASVSTAAHLQRMFPGAGNKIVVEFDHFAYNGTGADGIALTFSDAAVTPQAGAFGGSLGYAQKSNPGSDCTVVGGCPGFAGGWLGIGFDEFGNFSNDTEGRIDGPGSRPDRVAIRGSGSGQSGYVYHTGSALLSPGIDQSGTTPGPGHRYRVTIDHTDGVQAKVSIERSTDGGSTYATIIPQYDAKVQTGQAAVPENWLLSYTGSTGASTNIHEIDNLKVCAVKPIVPIGPNHYVISHSGTGLTCEAEPVTFTAHDAGHSRANAGGRTLSISTSTSTSKGAWLTAADNCSSTCYNSVGGTVACAGTFTGTTGNNGQASYLFANGETGIRLCLKHNVATTVNINVSDGSASEATGSAAGEAPPGADPALVFSDTGFRFYADGAVDAIGNLVAGLRSDVTDTTWQPSPQTIVIRALKSSETTPARCVSLLGSTAKTVQFGYECVDPNACHASSGGLEVNGAAVAGSAGVPTPASDVSVTFDGSGSGTINLKYWDVGQIKLYAQASIADAASGDVSIVTGASNGFIVKPYGFDVKACTGSTPCTTAYNAATDGTGSVFVKAGDVFNATVTAVAYGGTTVTPSFGLGTGNTTETVSLTPTLVAPAGGAAGALGGTALPKRNAFTDGVANLSDLNWSEVGVMKINAANTLFQTVTSAATGASGNIGRFTPHHFGVTGTVVTRSDMQTSEGQVVPFTYMGEPMKLALVVTAYNKAEGVTQNYKGNFAKLDAGTLGTTVANWTCTSGTQCMGLGIVSGGNLSARLGIDTASANSAVPANTTTAGGATAGWEAGTSYFSLNMVVSRDTAADGPYRNLKFGAKPRDADGVTLPPRLSTDTAHCVNLDVGSGNENPACDPGATETNLRRKLFETDLRFGRLWLGNAYGSDQRGLAVPYETQYWNGFAFVRNADDGLTPFAVGNISRVTSLTTTLALTNLSAGRGTIDLGTPNGRGTVDVYVNLDSAGAPSNCSGHAEGTTVARSYLSGKWCGTAHDRDPVARATFGIQAGRKGPIYIRENY